MFFLVFFLFNPTEAGMFQKQKNRFVPDVKQAEEIQKSGSMEFHNQSENVINVENCKYLKYFSSTFLVLFATCFYHFLFWRYLNSSMTSFSSDILLPFPNSNDLNSLPHLLTKIIQLEHRMMLLHNSQYSSRETTELNPVPAEIH